MLLGLFKNVNGCVSDSSKVVFFSGEANMSVALEVKSPLNLEY